MGVLRTLNVAPTQVYPNTWVSLQAFRLLCDVMRLHPTPSSFLCYYASYPAKKASWHSLAGRTGTVLFDSFATSYKRFKGRFVKVIIRPEATTLFFDESGRSRFPLYWTHEPFGFKEWLRPTEGADELEILSLFDALPRKLPCRRLIGAYAKSAHWATVRGMGFVYILLVGCYVGSVGRLVFLTWFCFVFADIMVQDRPSGVSALDKHKQRVTERKGCRSIEVMPAQKGSSSRPEKDLVGPSQKSKKRPREGGNIATTTRLPGSLSTPPLLAERWLWRVVPLPNTRRARLMETK